MLKRMEVMDFLGNLNDHDKESACTLFWSIPALDKIKEKPHLYAKTILYRLVVAVDNFWYVPKRKDQRPKARIRRKKSHRVILETGNLPIFYHDVIAFGCSELNKQLQDAIKERDCWQNKHKPESPH